MTDTAILDIAVKAVEIYALQHPRPSQVNQREGAKMLGISKTTMNHYVKNGRVRLNALGMIPITEIDRLVR